ncbi:MAG: hypothetical protein A2020_05375 [Lentisphaerae bacterium GWF2_45_14]|nr:MAG: hypothetical protein A2020_05375 [Lentisphaerae bacterium GWF2_45_14]
MPYDFHKFEEASMDFARRAEGTFSVSDSVRVLSGIVGASPDDEAELLREARAVFESCPDLFPTEDPDIYEPQNGFFNGASFLVTPTEYEIQNGILFPGHRFAPFCSQAIFPSEASISAGREKIVPREYKAKYADVIMYHSLIGVYEMLDFFVADHPDNFTIVDSDDKKGDVTLTVFDMKKAYSANSVKPGDAFLMKIENWAEGRFSFSYLSLKDRDVKEKKDWVTKLEKALGSVFDRFGNYLEISEQFAQSFHIDKSLIKKPAASLDEFIYMTEKVQIILMGSQTVLGPAEGDSSDESDPELPENVMVSTGKTSSLEEILNELGCPLKPIEIESYMLDELYNAGTSFQAFFERCFSGGTLNFADDAQEAVFMNYMEDLWERRGEIYNRFDDDKKGLVRAKVLEIVEERNSWLTGMKDDAAEQESFKKKIETLAESSARLRKLLEMLNSEDYAIDDVEMQNILDAVEDMADTQHGVIDP